MGRARGGGGCSSIGAYFVRTRRALGWFKDGHTTALPFEFVGEPPEGPFQLQLPIQVRVFHDGAYVNAAKDEGGVPQRRAHHARRDNGHGRNYSRSGRAMARQRRLGASLGRLSSGHARLCEGLGAVADASAPIVVEAMRGSRRIRATLRPRKGGARNLEMARTPTPRETWEREAGVGNYVRVEGAPSTSAATRWTTWKENLHRVHPRVLCRTGEPKRRSRDTRLRRNGGGNNYLPEPLRKRLLRSRFNRPGGLYVMTSPMTFSAAQNPTTRLERDSFAIFVGEPTGGAPNHYGDASNCAARRRALFRWSRPYRGSIPIRRMRGRGSCRTCHRPRCSRICGGRRSCARSCDGAHDRRRGQ